MPLPSRRTQGFYLVSTSIRDWIYEMDRLAMLPTPDVVAKTTAIVEKAYTEVLLRTHVISGRLKASTKSKISVTKNNRNSKIAGEISSGEGLEYARYEFSRRQPRPDWHTYPPHNPLDGLDLYEAEMDAVIDAVF